MKFCKLITFTLINIFSISAGAQTYPEIQARYQAAAPANSQTIARIFKGRKQVDLNCKAFSPNSTSAQPGKTLLPEQLEKDIQKSFGITISADPAKLSLSIHNGLPSSYSELLSLDQNGQLVFVKYPSGRSFDSPYITRYVRETESTLIMAELEYDLWTNDPSRRAIETYRLCELP